jgi:hypothetical protein
MLLETPEITEACKICSQIRFWWCMRIPVLYEIAFCPKTTYEADNIE